MQLVPLLTGTIDVDTGVVYNSMGLMHQLRDPFAIRRLHVACICSIT